MATHLSTRQHKSGSMLFFTLFLNEGMNLGEYRIWEEMREGDESVQNIMY